MRALLSIAVLMIVAACQTAPPPEPEFTDADRQAIAAEIERLTLEMNQLSTPEELGDYLSYMSVSADSYFTGEPAVMAFAATLYPSMQSVREFLDPSRWNRQSTNYTLESSNVAVLSPEHAVQVTKQFYTITNSAGVTGRRLREVATRVWVKEDVGWKMIHFHNSWISDPVEAEAEG